MNLDDMIAFEHSPWELRASHLRKGDTLHGVQLLTLLEGEPEDTVEDAFQTLEKLRVTLDLSGFPKAAGNGEAALRLRQEEQLARKGDLIRNLDEHDTLRIYLEELAGIPAFGDMDLLARDAAMQDEAAQMQLMNLSLSTVVDLARSYVGYGVLLLDLIQEGSLGLWQGILCWDGIGSFDEHRQWWIRQYMARAVIQQARAGGVGQKMKQALEDYRSADEQLLGELGRNPTLEEIAQMLHMTPEEAAVVRNMLESARMVSRAKTPETPADDPDEAEQAVEDTAYFQQRQRIEELLSGLTETEAKVLSLRFGLEGGLPVSQEDTGRRLGMTPDEVIALETAALAKLRKQNN